MHSRRSIASTLLGALLIVSAVIAYRPHYVSASLDYPNQVGITTVNSQYAFDGTEDVLTEGTDVIADLGADAVKLWLTPNYKLDYYLNSSWPTVWGLAELAATPYYEEAFAKFDVIALEAYEFHDSGDWHYGVSSADRDAIQAEFYELAKYLLETYEGTGKTFILQNWEGDNQMKYGGPGYSTTAAQGMIDWINARQDGIIQARDEVGEHGVRVMGAFEINRVSIVFGEPRLLDVVVPYTYCDLYSYSNYEVYFDGEQLAANLDDIAAKAPDDARYGHGDKNVFVGEFGRAENWTTEADTVRAVHTNVDAALAWGVPYMFYWQLYSNEDLAGLSQVKDMLNDYSKIYDRSANWTLDASSPTPYFEGDASRLKRTSDTPEHMTYKTQGGIHSFGISFYYTGSSLHDKVAVYYSADNVNWIPAVIGVSRPVNTDGIHVWHKASVGSAELLPDGYTYLKIVLDDDADVYSPQISQVVINQRPHRPFADADLNGYWLIRPSGAYAGTWHYFAGLYRSNALTNPGFEADGAATQTPAGWSTWAPNGDADANYSETGGSHAGSYHLTHWKDSTQYEVFTYQTATGLDDGVYTATAWVKSNGGAQQVRFLAKDFDGTSTVLSSPVGASPDWTFVWIDGIVVANGQATIGLHSAGGGGFEWAMMDDVKLFKSE
ncbi:hypothetical protein [Paenibacillus sp.]|uniref:hypothetical protein n=1 Tax=Paenibacillus sp. TaxID=58172 RepID=UPI002810B765|nr:hypothetical protein [Paenibacillus sp.]